MAFDLYQDVILAENLPADGLCAGGVGVVADRHESPSKETGYSVEFFDLTGRRVAVITVPGRFLRAPTSNDRPNSRRLVGTV